VTRGEAWRKRAEEATGSRPVHVGGGILDDIDALLAEEEAPEGPAEEPPPPPQGEEREPYL
jgi:hypothetical protein